MSKNPGTQPITPTPVPIKDPGTGTGKPTDGMFCVNSEKNGQWSSGFAWYANMASRISGSRPGSYVDVKKDGVVTWEGGSHRAKFTDGNTFTVTIDENAHATSKKPGTIVGKSRNSFREMVVRLDEYHLLYQVDGWKVYSVYYCS